MKLFEFSKPGVSGTTMEIPCTPPEGNPAPSVTWRRDGRDVFENNVKNR